METMLKPSQVASLMGVDIRTVQRHAKSGRLACEIQSNAKNRPEYVFSLTSLPSSIQEKYYARQRAEMSAVVDHSSKPTDKPAKAFDCYTEAEREEIVFWKRVLAEWEKYRQRGGMNAAELDKRFLAYRCV